MLTSRYVLNMRNIFFLYMSNCALCLLLLWIPFNSVYPADWEDKLHERFKYREHKVCTAQIMVHGLAQDRAIYCWREIFIFKWQVFFFFFLCCCYNIVLSWNCKSVRSDASVEDPVVFFSSPSVKMFCMLLIYLNDVNLVLNMITLKTVKLCCCFVEHAGRMYG